MKISPRAGLIVSFPVVMTFSGLAAGLISVHLIDKGVIQQAKDKLRNDLNSPRLIYNQEIERSANAVRFTPYAF